MVYTLHYANSSVRNSQTAVLTEQLDAAKNEENLAKGSLQRLRHKVSTYASSVQ